MFRLSRSKLLGRVTHDEFQAAVAYLSEAIRTTRPNTEFSILASEGGNTELQKRYPRAGIGTAGKEEHTDSYGRTSYTLEEFSKRSWDKSSEVQFTATSPSSEDSFMVTAVAHPRSSGTLRFYAQCAETVILDAIYAEYGKSGLGFFVGDGYEKVA